MALKLPLFHHAFAYSPDYDCFERLGGLRDKTEAEEAQRHSCDSYTERLKRYHSL